MPAVSALKVGITETEATCTKLRQELEALEKETAAKLAEMNHYNKVMQVKLIQYRNKKQNGFSMLNSFALS